MGNEYSRKLASKFIGKLILDLMIQATRENGSEVSSYEDYLVAKIEYSIWFSAS